MSGRKTARNSTRGRRISLLARPREVPVVDNRDDWPPDPDYLRFLQMVQDGDPTLPLYDEGLGLYEAQIARMRTTALQARGTSINPWEEAFPSTWGRTTNWEAKFIRTFGRIENVEEETQSTNDSSFQEIEEAQDVNPRSSYENSRARGSRTRS